MFGFSISNYDCWNGIPSSHTKGIPKKKVNYHASHYNKNSQQSNSTRRLSLFERLLRKVETKHWVYLGLISFLLMFLTYKWISRKLKNQSRMLKNL